MTATTVVSNDGWIPIPEEVRERLGLKGGSAVAFEFGPDGRVAFVPLPDVPPPSEIPSRLRVLIAAAEAGGPTTEELLAITRLRD